MILNIIDMKQGYPDHAPREFREFIVQYARTRLNDFSTYLGKRQYIVGDRFTAADLLMVSVLRILRNTDILQDYENLSGYQARGEARPAFQKALTAQMQPFERNAP